MFTLFFLVTSFSTSALADIGPPPSCPDGEYRTYLRGHRCVQNGNVLIDLSDFDIPWEIMDQLEDGEVTVPGLDTLDIKITAGTIQVKKEQENAVVQILNNFDKAKLVKIAEQADTLNKEENAASKNKMIAEEADAKAVEEKRLESKKTAPAQNNSKDCANVSIAQSLLLLFSAMMFSGLRRRF